MRSFIIPWCTVRQPRTDYIKKTDPAWDGPPTPFSGYLTEVWLEICKPTKKLDLCRLGPMWSSWAGLSWAGTLLTLYWVRYRDESRNPNPFRKAAATLPLGRSFTWRKRSGFRAPNLIFFWFGLGLGYIMV